MNVYIIDEFVSSQKNGIGTFINELIFSLRSLKLNICIIEFNSNEKIFCIKKENALRKICFPSFPDGRFPMYYKTIDKFFRLYIEDSQENVFMFNHSPCKKFMEAVKQSFPLSKIVFTIHDMGWTTRLLGDVDKYKEVILKRRQRKIKDTYEYILDYFDEERRMYAIADKVVCLSQDTHNLLIDTYKVEQSKIHLIPNGSRDIYIPVLESEIAFLKENMHIPKDEKIILYVGRLTEVKGCFVLLNCFKKVLEQYQNCRLVLAGTMQNSLPILELSSAFATRVSFTGLINRNELRKWYQIADIGIIPSFSEQSSYTAIEMMMYRLAIVSTNGYGLRDMFNNRKNALTVEVQRGENIKKYEENFTNAILEVLNNENLSQTLKAGARKTFLTKFEQKYMRVNYKNLFDY